MTSSPEIFQIVNYGEWQATPNKDLLFSTDHVIDAYVKGQKDGVEMGKALVGEAIQTNVDKSAELTKRIFDKLVQVGFHPQSAYLRIPRADRYDILVTLPEKEFLDDRVLKVYEFLADLESSSATKHYAVNISLSDVGEHFQEKCVATDGYYMKFGSSNK